MDIWEEPTDTRIAVAQERLFTELTQRGILSTTLSGRCISEHEADARADADVSRPDVDHKDVVITH